MFSEDPSRSSYINCLQFTLFYSDTGLDVILDGAYRVHNVRCAQRDRRAKPNDIDRREQLRSARHWRVKGRGTGNHGRCSGLIGQALHETFGAPVHHFPFPTIYHSRSLCTARSPSGTFFSMLSHPFFLRLLFSRKIR